MRLTCSILLLFMIQFGAACLINRTMSVEEIIKDCGGRSFQMNVETSDGEPLDLSRFTQEEVDRLCPTARVLIMQADFKMTKSQISLFQCKVKMTNKFNLELRENLRLKKIGGFEIPEPNLNSSGDLEIGFVKVAGNPLLKESIISEIWTAVYPENVDQMGNSTSYPSKYKGESPDDIGRNYVQNFGECIFSDRIHSLHQLDNCKYVVGDLDIEDVKGEITGNKKTKISEIRGCLRIIGTELRNIHFLNLQKPLKNICKNNATSRIVDNQDIWIQRFEKETLVYEEVGPNNQTVRKNIEISIHPKAISKCTGEETLTPALECTRVIDDLELTTGCSLHNIPKIQLIDGALSIKNYLNPFSLAPHSSPTSTRTASLLFSELKSVGNTNLGQTAINITDTDIGLIQFPKLKQALTNKAIAVNVQRNTFLEIEGETRNLLKIAAGSRKVVIGSSFHTVMERVKNVVGKITITGNHGAQINFPKLETVVTKREKARAINFYANEDTTISMPQLKSVYPSISFRSYKLAKKEAKKLFELSKGNLKYECDFQNKAIEKASDLDFCTSIKDGLILKQTRGFVNTTIEAIGGCLTIENTKLDDFRFLQLTRLSKSKKCISIIKGNEELCPGNEEIQNVRNGLKQPLEVTLDDSCPVTCSTFEFVNPMMNCGQYDGDIEILDDADLVLLAPVILRVKKLNGRIVIRNTEIKALVSPQLSIIQMREQTQDHTGNVIDIHGNNKLRTLFMPFLKHIRGPRINQKMKVSIGSNDGFRLSNRLIEVFKKETNLRYACHDTKEITDLASLQGCTEMSSGLILGRRVKGIPPNLTRINGCLRIQNTELTSIEFIQNISKIENCHGNHSIENNPDICLSKPEEILLRRTLKLPNQFLNVGGNKATGCPVICTTEDTQPSYKCEIIKGSIEVIDDCSLNENFTHVEEIRGRVKFSDCVITSIRDVFPKLKRIIEIDEDDKEIERVESVIWLHKTEGNFNFKEMKQIQMNVKSKTTVRVEYKRLTGYMEAADLQMDLGLNSTEILNVEETPKGVCMFLKPAVKVINCRKIEGDLILDKNTKLVTPTIREITGCLIMKFKDYTFLEKIGIVGETCRWYNAKTEISKNKCIPTKVREKLSGPVGKAVENGDNKKGCEQEDSEEEEGLSTLWIVGIVCLSIFLFLAVIGIAVGIYYYLKKKKAQKAKNTKKSKSGTNSKTSLSKEELTPLVKEDKTASAKESKEVVLKGGEEVA